MPVSPEKLLAHLNAPLTTILKKEGITPKSLSKKLKEELDAHEIKVFNTEDGIVYSDPLIAWQVRQKARMDAHRLLGHYPAEKTELDLKGVPLKIVYVNPEATTGKASRVKIGKPGNGSG